MVGKLWSNCAFACALCVFIVTVCKGMQIEHGVFSVTLFLQWAVHIFVAMDTY